MFRLVTQKFILQFQASNLMKEKKKKTDIFKNEREKKKKDILKLLIYYESNWVLVLIARMVKDAWLSYNHKLARMKAAWSWLNMVFK